MTNLAEKILAASADLIGEGGLSALSMREVARRAGVSHQAPYHYFADREAILAGVAEQGFVGLAAAIDAATAKKRSPSARLEAGGRAYVAFALEHPGHFAVMFRPDAVDPARYSELQEAASAAFQRLEGLVGDVAGAGLVDVRDQRGTTMLAWALVHGLSALALDGPIDAADVDAAIRSFHRLLER